MLNAALTRRTTLLAGAALGATALTSGCSDGTAPRATADARLRSTAARDSQDLLDRYDATRTAHPALHDRLSPLRAHVAAHLAAFRDGGGAASSGSPAGAASSSASAAAGPHRIRVPEGEKAARAALADAERRTADSRTRSLASASPALARLLASVAAAGAAHAYLLGEDH